MQIKSNGSGYTLWLSATDTYNWAQTPGKRWPCSTLSGNRCCIVVDSNGICDLTVNGQCEEGQIDCSELCAIVTDFIPAEYRRYWPVWESATLASAAAE